MANGARGHGAILARHWGPVIHAALRIYTRIHAAWCKRRARGRPPRDRRIPGSTQTEAYTLYYTELSLFSLSLLFSSLLPLLSPRTLRLAISSLRVSRIPLPSRVTLFFLTLHSLSFFPPPALLFFLSFLPSLARIRARISSLHSVRNLHIFSLSPSLSPSLIFSRPRTRCDTWHDPIGIIEFHS